MFIIKQNPARFSITDSSGSHKIFSYFNASVDGSLALHSYLDYIYIGKVDLEPDFKKKKINIGDVSKTKFRIHKTNFHKSGLINGKDKNGIKFSNDDKGMPFEEIPDAINLFYIQPTRINAYPKIQDNKEYIEIADSADNLFPPVIQGYLCRKSYNFEEEFIKNKSNKGKYFLDKNILDKFDLNLYLYVKKHKDGVYPNAEVIAAYKY
ncbi:MAG: hypothetical protein GF349_02925 [Candidatus Magasanikbacteria bacterium]|nr:hypothetical protein [Candidatus Magasanikbacteria bacterium]